MKTHEEIPNSVIEEAMPLIQRYGENIILLGKKNIWNVYMYEFPEGLFLGYPFIYLYDTEDGSTTTITGLDALDITNEFYNH